MMNPETLAAVLYNLGIEVLYIKDYELVAKCPGHVALLGKQDENPSWSINSDSLLHYCFSCGFKGSLLSLVSGVKKMSKEEAKEWIKDHRGLDVDSVLKRLVDMTDLRVSPYKPIPMSEARLAVFRDPPKYALDSRMISEDAASFYGILWDGKTDSWILPIRDDEGFLLGWQEKAFEGRFFKNRPLGVKKATTLFGIDRWKGPRMVLVESPLDAARLLSIGVEGAVASFGASVSAAQVSLMSMASDLIIALDNDPAGVKASSSILSSTKAGLLECRFFSYEDTDAKDVGDMSAGQIFQGIENARHCVLGERAFR